MGSWTRGLHMFAATAGLRPGEVAARTPLFFTPMLFPLRPKTLYGAARFAFGEI